MSAHTLDPAHVEWCRRMFYMLRVGGIWGVPRSGLIFTRTDEHTLTLTDRMPYMDGMEDVLTPAQLDEQQDAEYEACAEHFRAAGVTVLDATTARCPLCGSTDPECEDGCPAARGEA